MMHPPVPYHIKALIIPAGDNTGIADIRHIDGIAAARLLRRKRVLNADSPAGAHTVQRRIPRYDIPAGADDKGGEPALIGLPAGQLRSVALCHRTDIQAHAFLCKVHRPRFPVYYDILHIAEGQLFPQDIHIGQLGIGRVGGIARHILMPDRKHRPQCNIDLAVGFAVPFLAELKQIENFLPDGDRCFPGHVVYGFQVILAAVFIVDIIKPVKLLHPALDLPRIPRKLLLGLAVPYDLYHRIKGPVELGGIFGIAGIRHPLGAASGQQQEHRRQ